jgi:hypothetical protein
MIDFLIYIASLFNLEANLFIPLIVRIQLKKHFSVLERAFLLIYYIIYTSDFECVDIRR